ncbi:MAG: hypothetical protein CMJ76_08835 [Planctomycetaceae bacterium]|nr:hypothetical protein [Planctomycetaceae bacterium]|tara:strand:+ start:481 stop:1695 length:1215 start_codon:yes stop_codon:yes gene_type:complete
MNFQLVILVLCLLPVQLVTANEKQSTGWQLHLIDGVSKGADGARIADVNGDGLADLVTPWEEGGMIRVCLHPGKQNVRKPWPAVTVGKVASPEDAVFVDLDQDGRVDVVSSSEGALKTMHVHWAPEEPENYLAPEHWKTELIPATQGLQAWMFALPMNLDGQHGPDLVVSSKAVDASVGWLQAPADARNVDGWKYHRLTHAGWVMSLIKADINQDGINDILFTDRRGAGRGVKWLQNPGASKVQNQDAWNVHVLGGTNHEVMFMDYADFNADGIKDIAVATHQKEILLLQQNEQSGIWRDSMIPAPYDLLKGKSVRIGDINLDGVMDFVHSTEPNSGPRKPGVTWLKQVSNSEQSLQVMPVSDLRGTKFDLLQLVDIDEDGDLDVITCEERENLGLVWYENPTK